MRKVIKLMRIQHYVKNGLVFLPLVFSGKAFEYKLFALNIWGFLAFCMVSSVVYIVNDINDIERDRKHPKKKDRPLASGKVSMKIAYTIIFFCLVAAMWMTAIIRDVTGALCLCLYVLLNIMYSRGLKEVPILDIVILVFGFFIRVLYGALIMDIPISPWLFLTVIALSFYLGLGKRRNEIKVMGTCDTRGVLKYYNFQFLDKNMYVCMALTNVFYALWAAEYNKRAMICEYSGSL